MQNIDIFPWDVNFNTGIEIIDTQHNQLVSILNRLATNIAFKSNDNELNTIFDELTDYAIYHFQTEEAIWHKYLSDDPLDTKHHADHQEFIDTTLKLKAERYNRPISELTEEALEFLISWLALHILESDRHMAHIVLALQDGFSLEDAKKLAQEKINGSTNLLINIILSIYSSLSCSTLYLVRETNERIRSEEQLKYQNQYRRLLIELSSSFINLPFGRIDSAVQNALKDMAIFVGADRAYVFDYDFKEQTSSNTHEWCADGISQQIDFLQNLPIDLLSQWLQTHSEGKPVIVPDVTALPEGELRDILLKQDIQSLITLPLMSKSECKGFVGFDIVKKMHNFSETEVELLNLFTKLLVNINEKKQEKESLKEQQNRLEYIAHYDALTGLPNRTLLSDRLHQAMAQTEQNNKSLAIAYLDLDGFKTINNTYGHEDGDKLLAVLANKLKQTLRNGDTVARLGGDEFAVILLNLNGKEDCVPMLLRLLAVTSEATVIDDIEIHISASIGVTFFEYGNQLDADQLLREADQAMYQAKLSGKNRYHIFDAIQDHTIRTRHESLEAIEHALFNDEFVLYYQPKVNMHNGEVIGVEALIRWNHPQNGILPPALFLPVLEGHPLSIKVGEWVLNSAMGQIKRWKSKDLRIPVSVNIDALQLQQKDFTEQLRQLLALHPEVSHGDLELEILETSALEDIGHISQIMSECHEMGVDFSLDDFGTGYSSLTYLKRLPARELKIDQSFVKGMLDNPDDLAIIDGVLGLASAFRRDVIAEGVESIEHGEMLLSLGCKNAQGYAIARPMPAEELIDWIARWRPSPVWLNHTTISRDDLPLLYAEAEHKAWIHKIISHLNSEHQTTLSLDHHECHFGEWLYGAGEKRYGLHPAFKQAKKIHKEIHEKANLLINKPEAAQDTDERIDEINHLSGNLINLLKKLGRDSHNLKF